MTTKSTQAKVFKRHAWHKTVEERRQQQLITLDRQQELIEKLTGSFPKGVNASWHTDDLGIGYIRFFVELERFYNIETGKSEEVTSHETILATAWARKVSGVDGEKFLREREGRFAYKYSFKGTDDHGDYEVLLFIENPHPMNCTLVKVKKEVEVFESICS